MPAIDRLQKAHSVNHGVELVPSEVSELAEGIAHFMSRAAVAEHRLDIQARITTAIAVLLLEEVDLEMVEIPSEQFEKMQESASGFWVYYRPSTDSLLIGIGSIPEDLIEEEAEVVEAIQVPEVSVDLSESDTDTDSESPVPEDSEEAGGQGETDTTEG